MKTAPNTYRVKESLPLWNCAVARNSHPIESHRAADRMNTGDTLTKHEMYALRIIRANLGRTSEELAALLGFQ